MKKLWVGIAAVAIIIGASLTVGLSTGSSDSGSCKTHGKSFQVAIQNSKVSNNDIKGNVCDTITFTNKDDTAREIAFGPHEDHVPYDGIAERVLGKNQSFTITLDKIGSYHWHDHVHDEVEGYFTVTK